MRAQVLTLSPEGVLGQPLLPEGYVHDLVPGKTWVKTQETGAAVVTSTAGAWAKEP